MPTAAAFADRGNEMITLLSETRSTLRHARLPTRRRGAYPVAMPAAAKHWTVDDLATMPDDGNRYEIIDGELLVTPAPSFRHQRLVGLLYALILDYLRRHPIGDVLVAPADVVFARDTVFNPDLLVLPLVEGRKPRSWSDSGRLLLAVEALAPSTMRHDRYTKRPRYQREQVPECWIVDGDARVVERWRPGDELPEVLQQQMTWQPDPGYPPLLINLPVVFGEAEDG